MPLSFLGSRKDRDGNRSHDHGRSDKHARSAQSELEKRALRMLIAFALAVPLLGQSMPPGGVPISSDGVILPALSQAIFRALNTTPVSPAKAFVHQTAFTTDITGSTFGTVTTPALSTTTGHALFVGICSYDSGGTISFSATDTAGNTYHPATLLHAQSNFCQVFWSFGITGNASNVVTFTCGTTQCSYYGVWQGEASGSFSAKDVDTNANSAGTSATAFTGLAFSTAAANEVIITFTLNASGAGTVSGAWTAGSNFTNLAYDTVNGSGAVEWWIPTTTVTESSGTTYLTHPAPSTQFTTVAASFQ